MLKLDRKQLLHIQTLSSSEQFQTFLGWIRQSLAETDVQNRSLDGPHLHRGQGKALTLAEILNQVANVNQTLTNLNKNEERRQQEKPGFL